MLQELMDKGEWGFCFWVEILASNAITVL